MENKMRTTLNAVYFSGVFCVLALVAIAVFSRSAFDATVSNLLFRPLSPLEELLVRLTGNSGPPPFGIIYIYRRIPFVLAIGAIPMIIACAFFYKIYGASKGKHKFLKFNLIFTPAYICIAGLWITITQILWSLTDF